MRYYTWLFARYSVFLRIVVVLFCAFQVFIIFREFVFISSHIMTNSMEPTIFAGDYVFVTQLIPGWRQLKEDPVSKKYKAVRHTGIRCIKRNDIIVFNYPYEDSPSFMNLNDKIHYIKRCIALPGDKILIIQMIHVIGGHYLKVSLKGKQCLFGSQKIQKQMNTNGSGLVIFLTNTNNELVFNCLSFYLKIAKVMVEMI